MTNTILPNLGETPDIQRAIPIAMKTNPHRWMFFIVPSLSWQVDYFIQTPHVIGDASIRVKIIPVTMPPTQPSSATRAGDATRHPALLRRLRRLRPIGQVCSSDQPWSLCPRVDNIQSRD